VTSPTLAGGGGPEDRPVLCPSCGSRNKATWEFCVRCGEELAGAVAEDHESSPPIAASVPEAEASASTGGGGASLSWLLWGAAIVAAVVLWRALPPLEVAPQGQEILSAYASTPPPVVSSKPVLSGAAELFSRGRRELERGNAAGAVPLLSEAVSLEPNAATYRHTYARALWMNGQRADALSEYERAVALATQTPSYRADFARALQQEGRTADAVREFEAVLAQTPDDVETLRELGSLLRSTGAQERSTALLKRAVALRPTDLGLLNEVGRSLEAGGELQAAADAYNRILANFAGATIVRGRLSEVLLRQGKVDEALGTLEAGLQREPATTAPMRLLQGSILERSRRYSEAAARYREYVRLAPTAPDAKSIAARADEIEQRLAAAETAAKAAAAAETAPNPWPSPRG